MKQPDIKPSDMAASMEAARSFWGKIFVWGGGGVVGILLFWLFGGCQ